MTLAGLSVNFGNQVILNKITDASNTMSHTTLSNMSQINVIDTVMLQLQVNIYELTTSEEADEELLTSIEENIAYVDESIDLYEERISNDTDVKALANFKSLYETFKETYNTAISYNQDGKNSKALSLIQEQLADEFYEAEDVLIDIYNGIIEDAVTLRTTQDNLSGISDIISVIGYTAILLILIAFYFIIKRTIIKPTKDSAAELNQMLENMKNGNCDITQKLTVRSQDEIGDLVIGINAYIDTLASLITKMKEQSTLLQSNANTLAGDISTVNDKVSDTSAAMQQLASGMEEFQATTEDVTNSTQKLYDAMSEMAETASSGSDFADSMSKNANTLFRNNK